MKTRVSIVLFVALVSQQVCSQRLLGLMASAGLMRALRGREQNQKDSPSPLNQHQPEPVSGYPGASQGYRPAAGPSGQSYGGFQGYPGAGFGGAVSGFDGASPFGAASYGYPTFSQFGGGSYGGGYPGGNVGFAPSAFQGYGLSSGAEHATSASSPQGYQISPSSYSGAYAGAYSTAAKGYGG